MLERVPRPCWLIDYNTGNLIRYEKGPLPFCYLDVVIQNNRLLIEDTQPDYIPGKLAEWQSRLIPYEIIERASHLIATGTLKLRGAHSEDGYSQLDKLVRKGQPISEEGLALIGIKETIAIDSKLYAIWSDGDCTTVTITIADSKALKHVTLRYNTVEQLVLLIKYGRRG